MPEQTVQVFISEDERYPDFDLTENNGDFKVEISKKTLSRWKRIIKAYNKVQKEIDEVVERLRE